MPEGHPIGQVTVYENLQSEFWHAPPARELVQPYYFQTNERLPQYRTEEVLRRRMAELPSVSSWFRWTATSSSRQDAGEVRVVIEQDGVEQVLEGDYVVGCDGGHSPGAGAGRHRARHKLRRAGRPRRVPLAELHEALKRFPDRSTYRVMHPDLKGYWMFFGRVDVGEGFFFHAPVPPGTTAENFDVAELLHRAAGFPFAVEVDHVGFWDLRVQVAQRYRAGRAFIAGDAAHASALRRVRAQQRPGGRRQPRLEAGGPPGLG